MKIAKLLLGMFSLIIIIAGCNYISKDKTEIFAQNEKQIKGLPPENFDRGKLVKMPKYDPKSRDLFAPDLRSYDLSALNLTKNLTDLMYSTFNTQTKWTKAMPKSFEPDKVLEINKNPGLGIRELHKEGITGKGINVAIIDQGLLTSHEEYSKNLKMYKVMHCLDKHATMHGSAVSSILLGKTCGIAPDANLYYIATTTGDYKDGKFKFNMKYFANAVDEIIAVNKTLPEDQKIRVISASTGWNKEFPGNKEADAAMDRAIKANIFVIVNDPMRWHYGFDYSGLGKSCLSNPDNVNSFSPVTTLFGSNFLKWFPRHYENTLFIPMDSKTVASPTGNNEYVYYRNGGVSWTIPYIAGIYALACQVDPKITPDKFWQTALDTGSYIDYDYNGKTIKFGRIVNPVKLIHVLERK